MKKNIVIVILIAITGLSMFYASLKANEAASAAETARMNQEEAEMLQNEADVLRIAAQESAAEAKRQEALALSALQDCQNK